MDGGTRFFWALITALLGASLYFGTHAEQRRRAVQHVEGHVETGDVVRLVRVVDGDSLVVANPAGEHVAVRVLGIKTFEAAAKNDPFATIGQRAIESLTRMLDEEPIRVLVHATPKDKHGRVLATLYVGDKDVGLAQIQKGLALVYTVYPFPAMTLYLQEQAAARARSAGIWADPALAARADLLLRQWKQEAR